MVWGLSQNAANMHFIELFKVSSSLGFENLQKIKKFSKLLLSFEY